MSTQHQPVNFLGIEQESPPAGLRPFVRFPFIKSAAVGHLARAVDFEACAGRAVKLGQLEEAEHLRLQARAAWAKYRDVSR